MPTATVTSKGQVTIPKEIRDELRIEKGDRIEFQRKPDGSVLLVPAGVGLSTLRGILGKGSRRVSIDDMEAAIRRGATGS